MISNLLLCIFNVTDIVTLKLVNKNESFYHVGQNIDVAVFVSAICRPVERINKKKYTKTSAETYNSVLLFFVCRRPHKYPLILIVFVSFPMTGIIRGFIICLPLSLCVKQAEKKADNILLRMSVTRVYKVLWMKS